MYRYVDINLYIYTLIVSYEYESSSRNFCSSFVLQCIVVSVLFRARGFARDILYQPYLEYPEDRMNFLSIFKSITKEVLQRANYRAACC